MEERHLVLLEQERDAIVVLLDHLVLAAEHPVKLQAQALHLDAVPGEVLAGVLEMLGGLQ